MDGRLSTCVDPAWLDALVLIVTGSSTCAGTLVDERGTVATAYHCVATGLRSELTTHEGAVVLAHTFAVDVDDDLALLAAPELAGRPHLNIRGKPVLPGERVYGLGHPYAQAATGRLAGTLAFSVSEGIVSAVGDRVIQTDAGLNPGNSGGPLVDSQGEIAGVVSVKLAADNLSFATRASLLDELVVNPTLPPVLGGTWQAAFALVPLGGPYALAGEVVLVAKERVYLRTQVGGSLAEFPRPLAKLGLGLRQRVGRGGLSTAFDLGSSILAMQSEAGEGQLSAWIDGRITLGGIGVGASVCPVDGNWGVELSVQVAALHGVW